MVVCVLGLLCHNKGVELAETPEPFLFACAAFCAALLPLQLPATMFRIVAPVNLRPMTATCIPPENVVIALAFAAMVASAAAASTFVGGGVGICNTVALLGESWI